MGEALSLDVWYRVASFRVVGDWTLMCRRKRHSQGTNDRFRPRGGVQRSYVKSIHLSPKTRGDHSLRKMFGMKPEHQPDQARGSVQGLARYFGAVGSGSK